MNFKLNSRWPLLLETARLLAVLLVLGCSAGCVMREELPLHREMAPIPPGPVCRVAVLPFVNDSDYPLANVIAKKVFMAEFQELGDYQVLQEGDIHKTYQQQRIYPGRAPNLEQMRIVADRLKADVLVSGTIFEMREDPGLYSTVSPKIIMEIHIRDGRNGETLWTAYHHRQGSDYTKTMHFGTIHSVAGLSRQMVIEIINLWLEKGLPECNVLSRP